MYSFEKNNWTQLPMQSDCGKVGFAAPYAPVVCSAKYGVHVNLPRPKPMRPGFSQVK